MSNQTKTEATNANINNNKNSNKKRRNHTQFILRWLEQTKRGPRRTRSSIWPRNGFGGTFGR